MISNRVSKAGQPGLPPPGEVENIQALRGIAALLVVGAHLKFAYPRYFLLETQPHFIQSAYGAIGVDIFFIISGYVICLAACKRHHRPLEFFRARLARITPLYLVVTLVYLIKQLLHLRTFPFQSVWNSFFYLPIFDWQDYTEPILATGWSLSFELWFYTVFALLLNLWTPRKVALALPLLFAVGAALMIFYQPGWYFPRFIFHPFTLEFALGCLVFQTQERIHSPSAWTLLAGGVVGTIVFFFFKDSEILGHQQLLLSDRMDLAWLRFLIWGVPSALLVAGLVGLERNHDFVLPGILIFLGDISYSLYLTHIFSIETAQNLATRMGLQNSDAILALAIISCIGLAWLCRKWVEKPLTTAAQRWAKKYRTS